MKLTAELSKEEVTKLLTAYVEKKTKKKVGEVVVNDDLSVTITLSVEDGDES